MRIDKITIYNFKNLNNFFVDFDEGAPTTVILGRNGTGKSNLLEALIIIFRDLDLHRPPQFKYELDYLCRDRKIHIDADPGRSRQVIVTVGGEIVPYSRFSEDSERRYLPTYVFGYYSGPSNKMEVHFDEHQKRFYDTLIEGEGEGELLRPLLYARLVHSHFVLLSFFNEQDPFILSFLEEHLGIQGLDSVLFVMKKPPWKSKGGDPRFWNARGVVSRFLDKLYELALAPLRLSRHVKRDFKDKGTRLEHLYLYLKDMEALKELASIYGSQQEFFKALESTYISEVLSEVRIRVNVRNADGSLTFRDLSEGEQQLLMVLGLLRFTKEDEALFLLDEPDTHLNPAWGIQYLDFIEKVVGTQPTSQIIMSTHNPLVIAGLERDQVRVMQRDDETGQVSAVIPEDSPRGMGIDGILTSDIFGLRSALDPFTQRLVDERRELAVKKYLSEQESKRLEDLNNKLEGLDYSISTRDTLYTRFIKKMTEREAPEKRRLVALTPQQQKEQEELIREILDELEKEGLEA